MAIKVTFSANQRDITVGGLYQWDFGQTLEIECVDLGSEIMEVHFACRGMDEAIVRSCTFANGVGTVTIPDRCLEQTNNITAWIYQINSTQGHTVKTINLPITSRTRPSKTQDVPSEYIDKYAEALTKINESVNAIESGNITAAQATHAVNADSATTAQSATSATLATSATSATTAQSAMSATSAVSAANVPASGIKHVRVFDGKHYNSALLSMENFIKPARRYIVRLGEMYYTGYSNYSGDRIDFGGNTYMDEGRDSEGFVWTGTVATSGKIVYGGEGYGVSGRYLMMLSTMYGDVIECSEKMGSPKIATIYECETIADIISFTVDGTTYQVESGITWGAWVGSTTSSPFKILNGGVVTADGTKYISKNHSSPELSSDIITTSAYSTVILDGILDGDGDGNGEETRIISFTIQGKSYQAVSGMTWAEWCESSYNTPSTAYISGAYIEGETSRVKVPYAATTYGTVARFIIETDNPLYGQQENVYGTDTIIENGYYILWVAVNKGI